MSNPFDNVNLTGSRSQLPKEKHPAARAEVIYIFNLALQAGAITEGTKPAPRVINTYLRKAGEEYANQHTPILVAWAKQVKGKRQPGIILYNKLGFNVKEYETTRAFLDAVSALDA